MRIDRHLTPAEEKRLRAVLPGARLMKMERRGQCAWWPCTEVEMNASAATRVMRSAFGPTAQVRPYAQAGVPGLIAKSAQGVHAVVATEDYARLVWEALPVGTRSWVGVGS